MATFEFVELNDYVHWIRGHIVENKLPDESMALVEGLLFLEIHGSCSAAWRARRWCGVGPQSVRRPIFGRRNNARSLSMRLAESLSENEVTRDGLRKKW